jgi:hypothetical protein
MYGTSNTITEIEHKYRVAHMPLNTRRTASSEFFTIPYVTREWLPRNDNQN